MNNNPGYVRVRVTSTLTSSAFENRFLTSIPINELKVLVVKISLASYSIAIIN